MSQAVALFIYLNRPDGLRHSGSSRAAFQIWPHAAQRQYVKALTSLLVVRMLTELQKGQLLGAAVSAGLVYIRHVAARGNPRYRHELH